MYNGSHLEQEIIQAAMVMTLVIAVGIVAVILLVFYLFEAFALYRLSKNRGYQKAWLAFIPLVNSWVLGGIADHIALCAGRRTHWRAICLGVCGFWSAFYAIALGLEFFWIWDVLPAAMQSGSTNYSYIYSLLIDSNFYRAVSLLSPVMSLIGFARLGVLAFCWFSIYRDYAQKNAVLFLVLSLVSALFLGPAGIAPFFLFAIRSKPSASLYWASQPRPPYSPYGGYPPTGNPYGGPEGNGPWSAG